MKGSAVLKTRSIKSKYADVPASIEFSVIRRYRHSETKAVTDDYLGYIGRLNGWLTNPVLTRNDVMASQEKNRFHRWTRVAGSGCASNHVITKI